MTDTNQTGPAREGSTERCANDGCGHTKRDHSGRRDHTTKHPDIPLRPWCHACATDCLYEPPAAASAPVSPAPADWIALRDRVAVVLAEADGWEYAKGLGLRDMSESMQQHYDKLADAVVAVLPEPADRAAILREAADAIEEAQHLRDDTVNEALGFLDHNTEQQHKAVHRSSALLRRLAAAASGSCGVAGETQHPETPAPADPRSIDYHQVSPARLNPAVCICGLGPDAAIHNEPPHQFNSRLKASHHAAVHGICTDCHHHESAACHTAAVSQPDEEA
jgi:hypothetical protein